jgi:hypothetical protein
MTKLQLLAGARHFSLLHSIQSSSEAHPASYPKGIRGSFIVGEVAGAVS